MIRISDGEFLKLKGVDYKLAKIEKYVERNNKSGDCMPIELEEIIEFIRNIGYDVRKPERKSVSMSFLEL